MIVHGEAGIITGAISSYAGKREMFFWYREKGDGCQVKEVTQIHRLILVGSFFQFAVAILTGTGH